MRSIFISCIIFVSFCTFAQQIGTASDYFNAKLLTKNNINILIGLSLLKPPNSLSHSFAEDIFLQIGYRQDADGIPFGWTVNTKFAGNKRKPLHSVYLSSGVQFPKTNRKSPVYFNAVIGFYFFDNKKNGMTPFFELSSHFNVWRFSHNSFATMGVSVQYDFLSTRWWHTPQSINVVTGIDWNI